MGLALSKGLVEAMDGSLTAESVEGQGTTFTVELPERSHRLLSGAPSRP
ncbi:MAG TPA: ATP-binding protein [Actinomycetota bacterium]|nr:ATP-binding protein [Actinomycetota bacterium]